MNLVLLLWLNFRSWYLYITMTEISIDVLFSITLQKLNHSHDWNLTKFLRLSQTCRPSSCALITKYQAQNCLLRHVSDCWTILYETTLRNMAQNSGYLIFLKRKANWAINICNQRNRRIWLAKNTGKRMLSI